MASGADKDKKKRILAKGTLVEIAPFQGGHVFVDLGWLDGEKGVITSVGSGNPPRTLYVKLKGKPGSVGYPIDAVRPIEED